MAGKKQSQAILALEQKLRDNPQSRAFSRLADSYRRAGNLQTAVDLCVEGLTEHPDYVTGRVVLGRCYAQQKKYDAAVSELTRVCAADRRNHAAMKMLADIFVRQGRSETAGRIYAILRDMEPDNYHVRQLAAKYRSNIKGNIHDVLGISVNTDRVTKNLVDSGVNPFDMGVETIGSQTLADGGGWTQTGSVSAAREPTGKDIEAQLDSMFVTQGQPAAPFGVDPGAVTQIIEPAGGVSSGVSGSDVADQLDMIFGQPSAPPAGADVMAGVGPDVAQAAPQSGGLTGSDVADQLDIMFGQQPKAPPAGAAATPGIDTGVITSTMTDEPSGSDVADQLDIMFGQQPKAPPAGVAAMPGIDTGVITSTMADEPSGSDVADQLDIMFGQQPKAPPTSADTIPGIDTGVITSTMADEPSGSDVADQLDIMFGQQPKVPPAGAAAMPGIDTGVITSTMADEPIGSDVADQLDIMFGHEQAPSMDADAMAGLDTGIITMAADEPTGSDIEDRLDALFGNIAAPKAGAEISAPALTDNLIAEAQVSQSPSGVSAAEEYFRGELLSEPDLHEAAPAPADVGEMPAGLFDFNDAETMQIDKGDMHAAMGAGSAADASSGDEDLTGLDDPVAVEHNLTETITFKPNVPEEGAEIVHGEDIEERLSELFSDSEKVLEPAPVADDGEDTIEDIFDDATGVLSAEELAGLESVPADGVHDEELPESDTIPPEPEIASELPSTELPSADKAKDADTDIDAILASVDAEVDATMSGIDTNAISSESDIVTELSSTELPSADKMKDADTDIDAILASVDAEVGATMSGIDTNAISSESDIATELSSTELPSADKAKDADTDIDAILASVDAEVGATMSGIDTNAISSESDIVTELSSTELPSADKVKKDADTDIDAILASVDAEVDATMSGIDTNAISSESDIVTELSSTELPSADKVQKDADTDIDAILASVDAEVGATMSGIDTNAISSESDIVKELSSTELPSADKAKDADTDIDAILASVDAEVGATMSGIDTNAISSESDIATELSSTELPSVDKDVGADVEAETAMPPVDAGAISPEHEASLKPLDDVAAAEAPSVSLSQPDAAGGRNKLSEDDAQEKIRQLFKAESSEPVRVDVGADFADSAVDERDTPFDLPDHVLTPTLADIYLQQGQPRLALHIYERLAVRDPEDERLAAKIQDIRDILLQLPEPETEPPGEQPAKKSVTEKIQKTTGTKAAGRKKKGAEPKEDRRPLAGVRIKKKDGSPSKSKRKPS